jgi:hypothetical protein
MTSRFPGTTLRSSRGVFWPSGVTLRSTRVKTRSSKLLSRFTSRSTRIGPRSSRFPSRAALENKKTSSNLRKERLVDIPIKSCSISLTRIDASQNSLDVSKEIASDKGIRSGEIDEEAWLNSTKSSTETHMSVLSGDKPAAGTDTETSASDTESCASDMDADEAPVRDVGSLVHKSSTVDGEKKQAKPYIQEHRGNDGRDDVDDSEASDDGWIESAELSDDESDVTIPGCYTNTPSSKKQTCIEQNVDIQNSISVHTPSDEARDTDTRMHDHDHIQENLSLDKVDDNHTMAEGWIESGELSDMEDPEAMSPFDRDIEDVRSSDIDVQKLFAVPAENNMDTVRPSETLRSTDIDVQKLFSVHFDGSKAGNIVMQSGVEREAVHSSDVDVQKLFSVHTDDNTNGGRSTDGEKEAIHSSDVDVNKLI